MPNTATMPAPKVTTRKLAVQRALAKRMEGRPRLVHCYWSHMTWLAGTRRHFAKASSQQVRLAHAEDFLYNLGLAADCRNRLATRPT